MKVYNYFRSSTSHRLRIVLNLKGLNWDYVAVDLRAEAHFDAVFKALNPQGFVPALVDGDLILTQSPAIIEWLEERYPTPPLLPSNPDDRARVRALAALVGCDIHPLNNRRVLEYLRHTLGCDEAAVLTWCATWINDGFEALETMLAADPNRGNFCFGGGPTLADAYLVAQIESARRFKVDISPYPQILAIDLACGALAAFQLAAPAVQPDMPR
ncbi:maleylacetoacetate isomerase [Rhodoferax sp.]|uniref:maleylacetoacetate isomerase n=1 Tax=Rhodoferax sp. TaxID=50421 RepID=UPI00260CBA1B|nr:maleylacetoacetate isomerase [Rhodoferax sp.]MDD2926858.1 maleylacetoacetate isomerase [Rhodoferax sp.]